MNKILVVFTGGTIGCKIDNATINVDQATGQVLLDSLRERYPLDVDFEVVQPYNILSENCMPVTWEELAKVLGAIDLREYKGMIVTHGTDTLPYTAAFLGYYFRDTPIPIVITGSNYALEDKRSEGVLNFYHCVNLILHSDLTGVYVVFKNNKKRNMVYLATRLVEEEPYNDQFTGFGGEALGEIIDGEFQPFETPIHPETERLTRKRKKLFLSEAGFHYENSILAIRAYPGLNYDYFDLDKKPKAILHSLYHSGTGCTVGDHYSLLNFMQTCGERGIDFYLISLKDVESNLYITSRAMLTKGAVALQNISFEAALVKLTMAYNQQEYDPAEFMKKEIYYEFLPKKEQERSK